MSLCSTAKRIEVLQLSIDGVVLVNQVAVVLEDHLVVFVAQENSQVFDFIGMVLQECRGKRMPQTIKTQIDRPVEFLRRRKFVAKLIQVHSQRVWCPRVAQRVAEDWAGGILPIKTFDQRNSLRQEANSLDVLGAINSIFIQFFHVPKPPLRTVVAGLDLANC